MTIEEQHQEEAHTTATSALDSKNNVQKLLSKCEELVCRFDYDLALKFCEKILLASPDNVDALLMKATILIDISETDQAKEVLLKARDAQPNTGADKFVALAQLSSGEEALSYLRHAISILGQEEQDAVETNSQLISIYCLMAEIYMTDLCFSSDAEEQCEKFISTALALHPENYEALQTLANFKTSQSRPEEAKEALIKSIASWRTLPLEHEHYPSVEFRLACARLLIELESFVLAKEILEQLYQEDDEIIEVSYLLALAQYSLNEKESARIILDTAMRLARRIDDYVPEILDAMQELDEALFADGHVAKVDPEDIENGDEDDGEDDDENEEDYIDSDEDQKDDESDENNSQADDLMEI